MRGRIAASIVLAAAVVLGTAGCNLIAPQATLKHYDASDGVSGNVGDISVRNAMLISDDGTMANLVVTLVNDGSKSHRVEIQSSAAGSKSSNFVTVEPGAVRKVGGPGEASAIFTDIDSKPGTLHKVFFQYGDKTGVQLLVPVLTNQMEEYSSLAPAPQVAQ